MSRPRKITPEIRALLEAEAQRRAECRSNKSLARITGLSERYVAKVLSEIRHEIEREGEQFDVSRETVDA